MIRWKFTYDKDEEQDWLNEYAQRGWAMTNFFAGVVTFVPCRPGEYIYQIDLLPGKGLWADDYEGYVIFMNEIGGGGPAAVGPVGVPPQAGGGGALRGLHRRGV